MLAALPSLRAFCDVTDRRHDRADDLVAGHDHEGLGQSRIISRSVTNMKAWLFTILRNDFTVRCASVGARCRTATALTETLAHHPEQYGSLDLQDFRRALEQLPPDQREAIILVGASGFSYEEAATICGCALGTIKSRVKQGASKGCRKFSRLGEKTTTGPTRPPHPSPRVPSFPDAIPQRPVGRAKSL